MLQHRWVSCFAGVLMLGCGSGTGVDAGRLDASAAMDAAVRDDAATGPDAAAGSDAGEMIDGAVGDSAVADAATIDGAVGPDAGIDCSVIGCGAPVFCGETCDAPCGCCPCGSETFCADNDFVTCNGGCYERTACSSCIESSSGATCVTEDCGDIEAEYLVAVGTEAMMCGAPGMCHILDGHCGVGLGGCFHAVNTGVTQAQLNAIAARWTAIGCEAGRAVCDCAPPPTVVRCDAGGCLAR